MYDSTTNTFLEVVNRKDNVELSDGDITDSFDQRFHKHSGAVTDFPSQYPAAKRKSQATAMSPMRLCHRNNESVLF